MHTYRSRFTWVLLLLTWTNHIFADVSGTQQTLFEQHRIFGDAVVTGNTMMSPSLSSPLVNSFLLPSSSGDINTIPFDASIEGAYLFWTGSIANNIPSPRTFKSIDITKLFS